MKNAERQATNSARKTTTKIERVFQLQGGRKEAQRWGWT